MPPDLVTRASLFRRSFRYLRANGPLATMNTASEALEARLMAHPVARRVAAGPRGLAFALHGFLDRRFDRRNGTETSGAVPVEELGVDADTQDAIWYEPMSTKIFDAIEAG